MISKNKESNKQIKMSNIPYDVILEIISYIEDIDIRLSFGVINKLNIKKYDNIAKCVYRKEKNYLHGNTEYTLTNICDIFERNQHTWNDHMFMEICLRENTVYYCFTMFRLKELSTDYVHRCFLNTGGLDSYFWQMIYYEYVLN